MGSSNNMARGLGARRLMVFAMSTNRADAVGVFKLVVPLPEADPICNKAPVPPHMAGICLVQSRKPRLSY